MACRDSCPAILDQVTLVLTLPASQVVCERGFSQLKRIKTDWRAKLTNDSVNDQLGILLHTDDVDRFDPEAAVQVWLRSGRRKRRPTHALSSTPSGKRARLDESTDSDSDDDTEMGSDSDSDCSDM